jgi:peroxiredoxin
MQQTALAPAFLTTEEGHPFPEPLLRRFIAQSGRVHVLYFMRAAGCSICGAHVQQLAAEKQRLNELKVEVVIVVPEGEAEARALREEKKLPFAVVAGQDAHAQMGLTRAVFGSIQQSGTVVVDSTGNIALLTRATWPGNALDLPGVLAVLARLKGTGP